MSNASSVRIVPLEAWHASELQHMVRDPRVAIPAGLLASIPDGWAAGYIEARASAAAGGEADTNMRQTNGIWSTFRSYGIGTCSN